MNITRTHPRVATIPAGNKSEMDLSHSTIKKAAIATGVVTLATSLAGAPEVGLGAGLGYAFGEIFCPERKDPNKGELAVLTSPLSKSINKLKATPTKSVLAATALTACLGLLGSTLGPSGAAFGVSFGAGFVASQLT